MALALAAGMMRPSFAGRTLASAWSSGRNNFNLIRLVAALLVIYSHSWAITGTAGGDHVARLTLIKSAGAFAVDVFFVVSGFLIAASVQRSSARSFLWSRVLRIYPALIVCVLLSVFVLGPLLTTAADYWSNATTWRYLFANATLWRAEFWLPGVFDALPRTAVNGSLWTLPIEVRLYAALLIASLVGALMPRRYLPLWALAMCCAVAFAIWRHPLPEHLMYLSWACACFITGTLCWLWRDRIVLSPWIVIALLAVCAVSRGTATFQAAYFATVVYGTLYIAFLSKRTLIRENDFSYGVYLYGWPMQQLALLAGATTPLTNTLAATLLALACAAVSWFLIERPALRFKRNRNKSHSHSESVAQ